MYIYNFQNFDDISLRADQIQDFLLINNSNLIIEYETYDLMQYTKNKKLYILDTQ